MPRHLTRQLLAISLFLPTLAAAQGLVEYCPAAVADFNEDGTVNGTDFLLWQRESTATVVTPGDAIQVLNSFNPTDGSTCEIDTTLSVSDINGSQLIGITSRTNRSNPLLSLESALTDEQIPAGQRSTVFVDIRGTATGCTTEELRSIAPVFQKLEPPEVADASDDVKITSFGTFLVKLRDARTPSFLPMKMIQAVIKPFKLDCPGGAQPSPFFTARGAEPLDLNWLVDGGASQGETEQSELVVFVTPTILQQTCSRPNLGEVIPKVEIEVTATYGGGQVTMSGELDANNPAQSFPLPNDLNGGRTQYAFRVEARSPACVAVNGGAVGVILVTEDQGPGNVTRVEQPLRVIARKVPPGLSRD